MSSPYTNKNVQWSMILFGLNSISQSIFLFSTTWLIYALGGSNANLGSILGVSTLISVVFSLIFSKLADVYRRDIIIWITGFLALFGSAIIAISQNLKQVFIGQILLSLGGSALFPVFNALFADSIEMKHRNKLFGTSFLVSEGMFAFGNIIGYFVFKGMDTTDINSLNIGLIKLSLYIAVLIMLIGFLLSFKMRDKYSLEKIDNKIQEIKNSSEKLSLKESVQHLIKFDRNEFEKGSLRILGLSLIASYFIGFGAGNTIPYLPRLFFDIYSVNLSNLSLLFASMTILTAIWGKLTANLGDKKGRILIICINQMASVILLIVLSFYPPLIFALMTLIIRNAAMNGVSPLQNAIQMDYSPNSYRSMISALNEIAWLLFFSIGQIIGGILVDSTGFRLPILITASLYLFAVLIYIYIGKVMREVANEKSINKTDVLNKKS